MSFEEPQDVITIEGTEVRIMHLRDVIEAKRAAGRPKDLAILPILEQALEVHDAMNGDD
jgi:hypothetical protein